MIKVLFFASLREQLGCDGLEVPADQFASVSELRSQLEGKGDSWRTALSHAQLQVAVNQELASMDAAVHDGDEIAFFPPVTGG
ncbi:molybdopterin synthase sulfur carrier subunit [Microbulbifer hydrolyticus]|uniref:Molybdopterin synthase sulfur carrier subunit n=1 Tax=Microbulbifer hydrolyticus TaxID=48074 RepID=A0A6P1TDW7_9GAMM|nr:molybdopterin synthase sulfur carrier subunit [Microbulbifer hydrolyticus]MBB5212383.1 molybdopterin synthase sulfur carrier subunit [Microbulbifer hydrolyticus]QHQ40021.1 molybdopterin synthase sulfur carrier subunit [Microbulbifer hydrolyticus]